LKFAPHPNHLLANIDKASAYHTERRKIRREEQHIVFKYLPEACMQKELG
jgi:hypothetical protein